MISGKEKATIFLSIIGPQKAARLLRQLPEDVSNLLAARVATLPPPSPDVVNNLLAEMSSNLLSAPEEAQSIPENVDDSTIDEGEIKGEEIVEEQLEIIAEETVEESNFSKIPATHIADVIKDEKIRVINVILNILDENKAREVKSIIDLNRKHKVDLQELTPLPILEDIKSIIVNQIKQRLEA